MEMVKHGLTTLVDHLGPNDRVAIVAYTDRAWTVIDPTSVENRNYIISAINGLYPMNSTNTEAGLSLGYDLASRYYRDGAINRVILATDGAANVGNTDPNVLAQYAQDWYGRNIFLSTIGGRSSYNDQLLQCWPAGQRVYRSGQPTGRRADFCAGLGRPLRRSRKTPRFRSISTRTWCAVIACWATRTALWPIKISATTRSMPVKWARVIV
jgi:hypothetical protein